MRVIFTLLILVTVFILIDHQRLIYSKRPWHLLDWVILFYLD
jgi:hypothetical protein